jgi:hypothetical protein
LPGSLAPCRDPVQVGLKVKGEARLDSGVLVLLCLSFLAVSPHQNLRLAGPGRWEYRAVRLATKLAVRLATIEVIELAVDGTIR